MQAATLADRNGQVTLVGVEDIWNEIKDGASKAGDVVKGVVQKACSYTNMIPASSPYIGGAQVACAVTGATAAGMGLTQGAGGVVANALNPGGLLSNLQQQMTAAQQQAALMALSASKPWYKKPLPWVGIGAGVLGLGTVVVLATRHKGGGGRRGRR
jgi:hypothetical protein